MKSNIFKYIFIIFTIGILIFAIIKIKGEEKSRKENSETLGKTREKVTEFKLGVAEFDSTNPILSKNKNIQNIARIIFDSLVNLTYDYKATPGLATEWAKQNENTYLIKLRENVKWSDGESFSADDVKFTIEKLKELDTIYSANVAHITNVDIVDNLTIKLTLDSEVPFFEYNLIFPILSNKYYSDKEFSEGIVPIGTGMYKAVEVQDNAIILAKNDYYWNDAKKLTLEKIIINLYSSVGEMYSSFKMGSIDLVATHNINLKDYIGTIGYNSKEIKGREHIFLAFNTQSPFLSQIAIRKAIAFSIDKTNIVSSVFNNNYYISSFPLDYGSWIYQEQDTSIGYNLEQAKQFLIDDGWNYNYKYWQKVVNYKTQRITVNFVVKSSDETKISIAENIKTQLENQGIRVNLIKANDEQYQNYLVNKNYDIILCSIDLSLSPDLNTFFGDGNIANYSNEEVATILSEVKNLTDDNKLKEEYKRLGEIYKADLPYLSLCNNKFIVAYNSNLNGEVLPNWFNQFYNIEGWYK